MTKTGRVRAAAALGFLVALLAAPPPAGAGAESEVHDLDVAGVAQRVLYVAPARPRAVLVMLPGGAGHIGIADDGTLRAGGNFLVRTRPRFVAAGYAVLIPDAAGTGDLRGRRAGAGYAKIVEALAAFAREKAKAPVFLVGTSQGSIAAVNGAAHLGRGIAGLVVSSSVSRLGGSRETVFDPAPEKVAVPVLVLANSDDACKVSPPADAPKIAAAFTGAPEVKVITLSGGKTEGDPCEAHAPHGYFGIEPEAVGAITGWLDTHLKP